MGRLSRLRNRRSLHRRPGTRTPASITLVVCEGETEQYYFETLRATLRLPRPDVVVKKSAKGAAAASVVADAERRASEPGGYDIIYCAFDRDDAWDSGLALARILDVSTRRKNPIPLREASSTPCFEVWILLHHLRTSAPFRDCGDVAARIRAQVDPGYTKADPATVDRLVLKLDAAIDNAEWLEQKARETGGNPATAVHHLVRHFKAAAAARINP